MALLHSSSEVASKTELDIFTTPPTQISIKGGKSIPYKPLAALQDEAPIEFIIPGHGDDYIDLAHTILKLQVKIVTQTELMLAICPR